MLIQNIFSGIVFSQCMRLQPIVDDQGHMKLCMEALCVAFKKFGYLKTMLRNISVKVLSIKRQIETLKPVIEDDKAKSILTVLSFGADSKYFKITRQSIQWTLGYTF